MAVSGKASFPPTCNRQHAPTEFSSPVTAGVRLADGWLLRWVQIQNGLPALHTVLAPQRERPDLLVDQCAE